MRTRTITAVLLCVSIGAMTLGAAQAIAFREGVEQKSGLEETPAWLVTAKPTDLPEGACGLALFSGSLYVSDYYHRAIDIFSSAGQPAGKISLAGGDPRQETDTLNAVCGLAIDSAGKLYANELHKRVMLLPGEAVIDANESTGVAVDQADNVYVDDRSYVALYKAPVTPGDAPVQKIGLGNLIDGYGVAVDAAGKRVYVPDAAKDVVRVYEPAADPVNPVKVIEMPKPPAGRVDSLVDAGIAVDNSAGEGKGHLLVTEDLKPGAEEPEAAIYEFSAAGDFLDRLQRREYTLFGEKHNDPIFGEPSGVAVDPGSGELFVTTGNSNESNLLKYGPYELFAPPLAPPSGPPLAPAGAGSAVARPEADVPNGSSPRSPRGASASEVVQRRGVRVSFDGRLTPSALPRHGAAPVGIAVAAKIAATAGTAPPQLRRIAIAINRNGEFTTQGLPVCRLDQIQPSTTTDALAACRGSLVGEGRFSANVKLPEQSPFPSAGKVLAFNGRLHGKPAILAHIYGTEPAPTSVVLPFLIRGSQGTYGSVLEASLPAATGSWGYVTGLKMTLRRLFHYRGKSHSYLSAGCPAPAGFSSAVFPLARTSFSFAGGLTLVSILNRSCRAKG